MKHHESKRDSRQSNTTQPRPSPAKPSQGGYGHKSTTSGSTVPQGTGASKAGDEKSRAEEEPGTWTPEQ
jgi:hypothetical protein